MNIETGAHISSKNSSVLQGQAKFVTIFNAAQSKKWSTKKVVLMFYFSFNQTITEIKNGIGKD